MCAIKVIADKQDFESVTYITYISLGPVVNILAIISNANVLKNIRE